jgi:plastocyanin
MLRHLMTLTFVCTLACAASAGSLQVTVTDRDGRPAADVVVLIDAPGTHAPAAAAPVVSITQEGSRFVPTLTVVAVGSTLRFTNKDAYDHHVRAMPSGPLGAIAPVKAFELRLDAADEAPGQTDEYKPPVPVKRKANPVRSADVKVDQAGPIGLGCHIHSSMRGQVYVSPTPWFGKTDAQGVATIDNVPDGAVQVSLWHAEQLQDQAVQTARTGATPTKVSAQLNFTPRRRRS